MYLEPILSKMLTKKINFKNNNIQTKNTYRFILETDI